MVNRFDSLWFDTIISSDNKNNDISHGSTACTHGSEGFMARSIDKGNLLSLNDFLIGTDFLCDATVFSAGDIGMADAVDQCGLAMVDVSHDRNDRRTAISIDIFVENGNFGEIIDSTSGLFLEIESVFDADFGNQFIA